MEVRNDGAGEGRREAAVFHIRPLKLAAKSAPATLQHYTDPRVRIFVIWRSWDSTIHATSGRLAVGSRFMNEIRSAAKTSRQTRMANLNSGGGAAGAPPSLFFLPPRPGRVAHPQRAQHHSSQSCFALPPSLFIVGHIIIRFGE